MMMMIIIIIIIIITIIIIISGSQINSRLISCSTCSSWSIDWLIYLVSALVTFDLRYIYSGEGLLTETSHKYSRIRTHNLEVCSPVLYDFYRTIDSSILIIIIVVVVVVVVVMVVLTIVVLVAVVVVVL